MPAVAPRRLARLLLPAAMVLVGPGGPSIADAGAGPRGDARPLAIAAQEALPVPPGLEAAVDRARHRATADPSGRDGEPAALVMANAAQALRTRFTDRRVEVTPRPGKAAPWHWTMRLQSYGYGDVLQPVLDASPSATENGVEYRRGPLTEWYRNDARGLEQGFTLAAPPPGRGAAALVLRLALDGDLRPDLDATGQRLVLRGPDGAAVLIYAKLAAWDARGRVLPAWMALEPGGTSLSLTVKDDAARYPVTIDPLLSQQQKLIASDDAVEDEFGSAVALSGDTALVGAPSNDDAGDASGSAYVFTRSGTTWSEQQKLTASDIAAGDSFGLRVALSGDTAVVGALFDDDGGAMSGSAYVLTRSGTTWSQQQKLTASDAAAMDFFSQGVAISGDTAVVGADQDDDGGNFSGSAYVFTRTGTTWTQQQKLTASDAAVGRFFGTSLALSADTAVIGARGGSGSAYVFTVSGTTWSEQQKLTASDDAAGDFFGVAVALSGDSVVVGSSFDDDAGDASGSAYVFTRSGTTWSEQQKLTATDGAAGDLFGFSAALSGDDGVACGASSACHAVVTARDDDDAGGESGSAYVFTRTGATWTQEEKLTASDAAAGDEFGQSVALRGGTAVIGARSDGSGSAYVFANSAPMATTVTITGTPAVGQLLTGSYIYDDVDGDLEGTSTFRWLRNGTAIPGATATTYAPVLADAGTTLTFEVTPVAQTGISPGAPVASAGVVVINPNAAPTATAVTITGAPALGQLLTGSYTYGDVDGDLEGASTFRWLRSGTAIAGATGLTYAPGLSDVGATLTFEATPVAVTGLSPGLASESPGVVVSAKVGVGEGAFGGAVLSFLTALNSAPTATTLGFAFQPEEGKGTEGTTTRLVSGQGRATVTLQTDVAPLLRRAPTGVATTVTSPAVIAVEEATYFNAGSTFTGGHRVRAIPPSLTRHFAQASEKQVDLGSGPVDFFDGYLLVGNDNDGPATLTVRVLPQPPLAAFTPPPVVVPANTRLTLPLATAIPAVAGTPLALVVTSDVPVSTTRAQYFGGPPSFVGALASEGVVAPGLTHLFAEGTTRAGFDVYYAIGNANLAPATVTLTHTLETGAGVVQTVTVPGETQAEVYVNGAAAAFLAGVDFWTRVTGDRPVAVERLIYGPGPAPGTWVLGHGSPGAPQAGLRFGFGEGVVGLFPGFQTFLALANPSPTLPVTLDATYARETGAPVVKRYTIPPMRRVNVWVNVEVPELADEGFGVVLASTNGNPFVADESVYWNGFTGGASTTGTPLP